MSKNVLLLSELQGEHVQMAGGKGRMLAKMLQSGYPVPNGFIILPDSFKGDRLRDEAWKSIQDNLDMLRREDRNVSFAVRSSAINEDSDAASFAGEFETVLNVKSNDDVFNAIHSVHKSTQSERVKAYSSFHGMEENHQISIVVQVMIKSNISGVLFTSDPITGNHNYMTGNFVYGLGEQLVSGEVNAHEFKLMLHSGRYEGPSEFKKIAKKLYKHAVKLKDQMSEPQDIEWAVADGKLYLLQARPITTLSGFNPNTYECNDTMIGDFLWSNTNVGEAIPDVVTPLTWSVLKAFSQESNIIPGNYSMTGIICGRIYANIGLIASIYPAFGFNIKHAFKKFGDLIGELPKDMEIPLYPFKAIPLIMGMLPKMMHQIKMLSKASKEMEEYLRDSQDWCQEMRSKILLSKTGEELVALWKNELMPRYFKAQWMMRAGANQFTRVAFSLNRDLTKLVGVADTNMILSNLRGSGELASLGPLLGLSKVVHGQLSKEEYLAKYGHRGPHEMELSFPRLTENVESLEQQIEEFLKSDTDVDKLLENQNREFEDAWSRFKELYPQKVKVFEKRTKKASEYAHLRESARSEFVRLFGTIRVFALHVGEIMGVGEDMFFLYLDEIIDLLIGKDSALQYVAARRSTYKSYKTLPPFPALIRGRFNPFNWVQNENRRSDYYDANRPLAVENSDKLTGFAGAAGQIKGVVRIVNSPEEGIELLQGEILVTSTTNVGWTPLFPRAAAIITDTGAPLSHAAIVARELGIPAVVGCGNATSRLKTGDHVIVDGGKGIVHIL